VTKTEEALTRYRMSGLFKCRFEAHECRVNLLFACKIVNHAFEGSKNYFIHYACEIDRSR